MRGCLRFRDVRVAPVIGNAAAVHLLLRHQLRRLEQEQFWVLPIDVQNRLIVCEMIAKGTAISVDAYPRDIFRTAIRRNAVGLVVAHNHPSEDPTPSVEDLALTRRLRDAGALLGIPLIDHVVLAKQTFRSIQEWMGAEF